MKYYEKINRYLGKEMSEDEQKEFKEELYNNSDLKLEFLMQKSETLAIEKLAAKDLKNKVREFRNRNAQRRKKLLILFLLLVGLSTLIGALLIITGKPKAEIIESNTSDQNVINSDNSSETPISTDTIIDNQETLENTDEELNPENERKSPPDTQQTKDQPPSHQVVAMNTFLETERSINLKGDDTNTRDKSLSRAYTAYENKLWNNVIEFAEPFRNDSIWSLNALELIGKAAFQDFQFTKAADTFFELVNKEDLLYGDRWEWYLLLSYAAILNERKDDFDQLSNIILGDPDHSYFLKVDKLKNDLNFL